MTLGITGIEPGRKRKEKTLSAKALLEILVGVSLFSLLYFLATRSASLWISFPLFMLAMGILGAAGMAIRRECHLD